jgi:hypothetical protein
MSTVHAVLVFPATGVAHRLAVVRARVEDGRRADAPARTLGQAEVRDVVVPAAGRELPVDIPVDGAIEVDAPGFTVRGHGSVSGEEQFATGDFLTTQSVRPETRVRVPLQQI